MLLYPAGLDYIAAFIGCLYAGLIAVPVYPPSSNRLLARVQAIATDAKAVAALTSEQILKRIRNGKKFLPEMLELHWTQLMTVPFRGMKAHGGHISQSATT